MAPTWHCQRLPPSTRPAIGEVATCSHITTQQLLVLTGVSARLLDSLLTPPPVNDAAVCGEADEGAATNGCGSVL